MGAEDNPGSVHIGRWERPSAWRGQFVCDADGGHGLGALSLHYGLRS